MFWIGLGLACSSLVKWGIYPVLAIIAGLVVTVAFVKGGRDTLHLLKASLADGARAALPVGIACAVVGVIIGVLTLTGAASNFAGFILGVGEKSLFLSLVLTMLICLVLGMGIPTIPNYIITSAIAAPALLKLGVPLIVSHMFVFYFGIMADLTPPVALAAFAASSIAKEPGMKIGLKAVQIAVAGFVIPFMAVYDPALMLQGNPSLLAVTYIVGKALLGDHSLGRRRNRLPVVAAQSRRARYFGSQCRHADRRAPGHRRDRLRARRPVFSLARAAQPPPMPLCLTAGTAAAVLALNSFTLAWNHSIEKIRWEEDWQIADARLRLVEARVRGTGAGMEAPAGAVLRDGVWHYRPPVQPLEHLQLAHSPHTAEYELCDEKTCQSLSNLLPELEATAVVKISPCAASPEIGTKAKP